MIDDAMEPKKLHPGQTIISVNAASSRVTDGGFEKPFSLCDSLSCVMTGGVADDAVWFL